MAIDTNLVIDSYAKDGTLPSQGGAGASDIYFDTAMTTNNGDVAGPPADGTATFAGRIVVVRLNSATEEVRYMNSEPTSTTATVSEPWAAAPVSGDPYHIFYFTTDLDTKGNTFKELLKRVNDWAASDPITMQSGSGFGLYDGHSIETVDNSSTTVADIIVESGGHFISGYSAAGSPVAGGYIVATPAVDGELAMDVQSGGRADLYDFFLTSVKENLTLFNGHGD